MRQAAPVNVEMRRRDAPGRRCVSRPLAVQPRSAGVCDDATSTVANPLQQRIACCYSAQQVCATTQPIRLPIRCNSAQCDDAALLHQIAIRFNSASRVATAHRVLQQRSVPPHSTSAPQRIPLHRSVACCNITQFRVRTRRRSTCCSAAQRCSLLQRLVSCRGATKPRAARDNRLRRSAVRCNRPQPAATARSPLQPAVAIAAQRIQHGDNTACATAQQLNRWQRSATCCDPVPSVATDTNDCNLLQRSQRSAGHPMAAAQRVPQHSRTICCNTAQAVATQCVRCNKPFSHCYLLQRLQPVAAISTQRSNMCTVQRVAKQQRNLLLRRVIGCNRPQPFGTWCSDCNAVQRARHRSSNTGCNTAQRHMAFAGAAGARVCALALEFAAARCNAPTAPVRAHGRIRACCPADLLLASTRWGSRSTHTWVLPSDDAYATACTSGRIRACRPAKRLPSDHAVSIAWPTRGNHSSV
jgi:hypothetical protein